MPVPSRRLIVLVAAAAPLFFAGAVVEPLAALGLVYVALLALAAALDLALLRRRTQVSVDRCVADRLSILVPANVVLKLQNRSPSRVEVRFSEDLPDGVEADPAFIACVLQPGERRELTYRLTASKRGRYTLEGLDVRILPWPGLFFRQARVAMASALEVFPNLTDLRRYDLLLRKGLTYEQGLAKLWQRGLGSEFESLRHYASGDDLGSVDWKATARRGSLIVRNLQAERQQSVIVAIDVGRATAGEFGGMSRLDWFVNATLMLAYVALRQGDWFSLTAFSDRIESYLPPVRGVKSVELAARALHALQPRLVESDYAGACGFLALKNRRRSLIVLMTDVVDRDASEPIIGQLARFAKVHLPLAVTLQNQEVQELAKEPLRKSTDPYVRAAAVDTQEAREEALARMRRLGVGVLDVPPKALTPSLLNRYLAIKATRRL